MSKGRKFFGTGLVWLAGVVLAIAVVAALSAYGLVTRSPAPERVQRILQRYTGPAVAVGATIGEMRATVRVPFTFVPRFGYVAHVGDSTGVSELRLLLRPESRGKPSDDDRADAVELMTTSRDAFTTLAEEVSTYIRDPPREGCLVLSEPGNYREVRYWVTPLRTGGVALTNDFGGNRTVRHKGMVVVGLLAFGGWFRGGETMRGDYRAKPCAVVAGLDR